VLGLLIGKTVLITGLARAFGQPWPLALHLGILLAEAGEFAFVLFGAAGVVGLLPAAESQILIVAVALSMVATPFLAWLGERVARRIERSEAVGVDETREDIERLGDHVVIAGFGRVGAAVATSLEEAGVRYVAVDMDPARVATARQRGRPVYYGDITLPEILAALHVERARSMVVALDNPRTAVQLVALVSYIFPDLKIYARARDEGHARELQELGADSVVPELVATGKQLAGSIIGG
jgi:CPA2 family monovalent cation:H+ antiporter-2